MMTDELVTKYFEKAIALVLASAGIDRVEKQALHLLASEAKRYASSLGAQAALLAEAARRTECTAADIEAAAKCINKDRKAVLDACPKFTVSSELKKKLRLSVEISSAIEKPVTADVQFPPDSIEARSPTKAPTKRLTAYPEWLQRNIETKHQEAAARAPAHRISAEHVHASGLSNEPLSFISALVQAEEESREILTKRLKTELETYHVQKGIDESNS